MFNPHIRNASDLCKPQTRVRQMQSFPSANQNLSPFRRCDYAGVAGWLIRVLISPANLLLHSSASLLIKGLHFKLLWQSTSGKDSSFAMIFLCKTIKTSRFTTRKAAPVIDNFGNLSFSGREGINLGKASVCLRH
ncbi:hypothetical protein [Pseudaquabacterium pictum]|uniref:hypothetical protein n=1 Tax=Pseudaquabacterium pictum TaxID=2315236 RepID=UPI00139692D7|nr:hypothetical protein [Rubrivivax pictus]